jgi:NAD(P)-dependent dehydrogenase (short-subunit alcohol dehydrogenase family)
MRLQNKIAVVTGASSGIGEAIAKMFAKEGASVICGSTNEEKGQKVISEIVAAGGKAEYVKTDVSDPSNMENLIKTAVTRFGGLHVMVNNAGISRPGGIIECSLPDWQKVIDVNLSGVFYGIKFAAQVMKENQTKGSIISIGSILSSVGFPGAIAYAAAKGGVLNLTHAAALDLAPFNIRVNAIGPGFIKTEMTKDILNNPEFNKMIVGNTPLGKVGEPEDIAMAAIYLASDEASYVTGEYLAVDGGWLAR